MPLYLGEPIGRGSGNIQEEANCWRAKAATMGIVKRCRPARGDIPDQSPTSALPDSQPSAYPSRPDRQKPAGPIGHRQRSDSLLCRRGSRSGKRGRTCAGVGVAGLSQTISYQRLVRSPIHSVTDSINIDMKMELTGRTGSARPLLRPESPGHQWPGRPCPLVDRPLVRAAQRTGTGQSVRATFRCLC